MDQDEDRIYQQRREKQSFLKSEIIDAGYDGKQFSKFLNSKRVYGGDDIDMWSLFELKKLVREFISSANPQQNRSAEPYETLDADPQKEPEVPDTLKDDQFNELLHVKVSDSSPLNDQRNISITVDDPEMIKGGLLQASYVQYTVDTRPFGWSVKRRFSDFLWLRSTLQKLHLGYVVPPVPQKKNKGQFENDFIRKRMYFLERFINDCVNHDDFKSDPFLYFFLSLADEDQFRARVREAEKLMKISRIDEISNDTGVIQLEINSDLKIFTSYVRELLDQTDPLYAKIRKLSKKMSKELEQAANTMFGIGECYTAMHANLKGFNENTDIGKQLGMEGFYLILNNMIVPWAEQFNDQARIVRKNLSHFYKYAFYENASFKEIVYARIKAGNEYLQKKKDLLAKKERLFQQGDITKWEMLPEDLKQNTKEQLLKNKALSFELMLNRETAAVRELRDLFAYQNSMTFNEITKALKYKCKQYSTNFHELADCQADVISQIHKHWAKMMSYFGDESDKDTNIRIMDRTKPNLSNLRGARGRDTTKFTGFT